MKPRTSTTPDGSDRAARRPRRRKLRDEASNSFALFIVMAPVIFGAFGIGLDISRNVYIRTSLQNSLDMATVAGAGVTTVGNHGGVKVNSTKAIDAVELIYAKNRAGTPSLSCWGDQAAIPGTTRRRCWKVEDYTVNNQYIQYVARERTKNAFLPIIGVKWQKYTVTSQARIKQATD